MADGRRQRQWDGQSRLPLTQLALRQRGESQHRLYHMLPGMFSDTVNYLARDGDVEIWKIINLSPDTHPIHIHLIHFKLLARNTYTAVERVLEQDATNDNTAGGHAIQFDPTADTIALDPAETSWKDTIQVNPSELVVLAVPFMAYAATDTAPEQGSRLCRTGRYMYHCHILEHEDHEMMRPLVVMPPEVIDHMHAVDTAQIAPSAEPSTQPTGWGRHQPFGRWMPSAHGEDRAHTTRYTRLDRIHYACGCGT